MGNFNTSKATEVVANSLEIAPSSANSADPAKVPSIKNNSSYPADDKKPLIESMKMLAYVRSLHLLHIAELPTINQLKPEIIKLMNQDFCLAFAGSTPVLIHEYSRSENRPFRSTKVKTEGYLDFLTAIPYQMIIKSEEEGGFPSRERKEFNGFKYWLKSTYADMRQSIKFDPTSVENDGDYNLWRGFPSFLSEVAPDTGYVEVFKNYINDAIAPCEPEAAIYLINWLAHLVQFPWAKIGVAIAVNSPNIKGTGKSLLADIMRVLCGNHYIRLTNSKQLLGQFTGHLSDKIFINAEESCFVGDQKANDSLKSLITSGTQFIESKQKDGFEVDSYARLYITSNHAHFVQASADERRFLILNNTNRIRHEDPDYFGRVAVTNEVTGAVDRMKVAALYQYLRDIDLSEFDPRQIPETEEMRVQKEMSFTPIEAFVRSIISGHYNDPDNLGLPDPYEYWHDVDNKQSWFKKDCMFTRFKEFQNDAYHPSKRMFVARNSVKKALVSTGLYDTHISEKQAGASNFLKRGARYFVFDIDE